MLNQLIDDYYEARREYERLRTLATAAELTRRSKEAKLVDYMLEHEIKSVDRMDGTKPLLAKTTTISVTKDKADQIRAWLVATVGDDKDYVETLPSKSAVLELVKKMIEKDLVDPSEFPEFLSVNTRPTLRVNGWTGLGAEE